MNMSLNEIKKFAARIRIESLKSMATVGGGHVGGAMSMADLIAVLYGSVMKIDPKNPSMEERDWLVVSKGHSGPSLYAALALKGYFPMEALKTLNSGGTMLPSHCDRNLTPGIDMSTGSLGQGVSTAIGVAWGNRYRNKDSYTYLVIGDGEAQEGQVWEGIMFAAQKKLSNLIAFVDYNRKQLDGYTYDINDLGDLVQKFTDFGWNAVECDGHDPAALIEAIRRVKQQQEKPSVVVMNTIKGKDCSFAEEVLYNHHMAVSQEEFDKAIAQLELKLEALEKEGE